MYIFKCLLVAPLQFSEFHRDVLSVFGQTDTLSAYSQESQNHGNKYIQHACLLSKLNMVQKHINRVTNMHTLHICNVYIHLGMLSVN